MKKLLLISLIALTVVTPALAQDVREAVKKAETDRAAAEARAKEVEAKILADRDALMKEITELETRQKQLETDIKALQSRRQSAHDRHERLGEKWSGEEVEFREISGNVRMAAKDIDALLLTSPITALDPKRHEAIRPLLQEGYFPGIDDISAMSAVLFDEMSRSSQVRLQKGKYVGRDGVEHDADILTLGRFTSMYRDGKEVGFLSYSPGEMPSESKLVALSVLPSGGMARDMKHYFAGKGSMVPIDIAGGESLSQLTHHLSLKEEFKLGGNIMWPIMIVGLWVVLFTLYKFIYLKRVHGDTDKIMGEVTELAARNDWEGVERVMTTHKNHNWPVVNVLRDGIKARSEDRETLENVLQESILREMPRLEKGLSFMAALGAIAPLLGLLGTVTGMIRTFNVITVYGTGDPKLMSGGISEALIATKWGLCIAVPTMLLHVFLARRAQGVVSDMEEKAVGLTNVVQKEQRRGNLAASA
jgi:biopolymer transport protein ExbB